MSGWILRLGSKARGFRYQRQDGSVVRDRRLLERVDSLRLPPAWTDVHVAESARAGIQAWGFNARGRKQYRYHEREVARGQLRKYHRVRQMARDLPAIRRAIARDLKRRDLDRPRVAAAAVRLIGEAFFRVGSERYVRENGTFGLTTLRKSHVTVVDGRLVFNYRGKSSIRQRQVVTDAVLGQFVSRLRQTPGRRLFRYRENGAWHDLTAREVNDYLKSLTGISYTAKDFRTWGGTLRLATVLAELGPSKSEREAKKNVVTAIRLVAADLGNTPAICRASYIHPMVIVRYLDDGETIAVDRTPAGRKGPAHTAEERALIEFLDRVFPERRKTPRDTD